jgi:hypothetical protein
MSRELVNDDDFMARWWLAVNEAAKELSEMPIDYKFFVGDLVKIDGVMHVYDGDRWVKYD